MTAAVPSPPAGHRLIPSVRPNAAIPMWPLGVASASHLPNHCHWIALHSTGRYDQTRRTIAFARQPGPTEVASFPPFFLAFAWPRLPQKPIIFFAQHQILCVSLNYKTLTSQSFFVCFFQYNGINWKQTRRKTVCHSEIKKRYHLQPFFVFSTYAQTLRSRFLMRFWQRDLGENFDKSTAQTIKKKGSALC